MSAIFTQISEWIGTRPFWEQAALDRVIAGTPLTSEDYDQIIQWCLEDAGLRERVSERPMLKYLREAETKPAEKRGPVKLVELSNVQNVNALAANQTLSFHPSLTAVFGANGSGKSGYARILAKAGFSRGDKDILPDIMQPFGSVGEPTVELDILTEADTHLRISYKVGERCPELKSVYVFDSTSVVIHLTKSEKLSFSPAGLEYLTQLSNVVTECCQRLDATIRNCFSTPPFAARFSGASDAKNLLSGLSSKTNTERLKKLASLTEDEDHRLKELDLRIAQLKSDVVSEQIRLLKQAITDLEQLIRRLRTIEGAVCDSIMGDVTENIRLINQIQEKTKAEGVDRFKSSGFKGIGSPEWHKFIEAANTLAGVQDGGDVSYPAEGDKCILCHQQLGTDAQALLHSLWAFLRADTQAQLDQARIELERKRRAISLVELDCFNDQFVSYRHLQGRDALLVEKITTFIEESRARKTATLQSIKDLKALISGSVPAPPVSEIESVIVGLKGELQELEKKNPEKEIEALEKEAVALSSRVKLGECLPEIEEYVTKQKWAEQAKKAMGSTRHITQKHNELFQTLVTDRYIQLFASILEELNCPLNVRVSTKGQKGDTLKQIVLEADPSNKQGVAKPDKILSEGEKRAVALADFLTEASLDDGCHVLVLDDPVTSLDCDWKETVARRLVSESGERQVIIFTHDLHFLYLLRSYATETDIEMVAHWIERGPNDNKPGYIYLNNSPLSEHESKSTHKSLRFLERARQANSPEEREAWLQQGFGALRTTYEAFIIFDLFGGVVRRFEEHIKVNNLKEVFVDDEVMKEVVSKFNFLSRYIEGHLSSDVFSAKRPSPELLKQEIDSFSKLQSKYKALKSAKKKSVS
jgi:energy-coupling factor transporter ATP-binding protein EcfA2